MNPKKDKIIEDYVEALEQEPGFLLFLDEYENEGEDYGD